MQNRLWRCEHCSLLNRQSDTSCIACFSPRSTFEENDEDLKEVDPPQTRSNAMTTTTVEETKHDPSEVETPTTRFIHLSTRDIRLDCDIVREHQLRNHTYVPLLLLHGFLDTKRSWTKVTKKLVSYEGAIIIPSLRGSGRSQPPSKESNTATLNELLLDIIALLDALKISRVIWVGHNLGSFVAQLAAIEHPKYVHKLVLISTSYVIPSEASNAWNTVMERHEKLSEDAIAQLRSAADPNLDKSASKDFLSRSMQESLLTHYGIVKSLWRDTCVNFNTLNRLRDIKCPTCIFLGKDDVFFPRKYQFDCNKRIKKGMVTPFSNAGHYCLWSDHVVGSVALIIWDFARQA